MLEAGAQDDEHAALLREIGVRSEIIVALRAHDDRTIGALALVTAGSGRSFGEGGVAFATEVAWRVAMAVENSRRFTRQ